MSPLLLLNALLVTIGAGGGPLVMRLYFLHGGHRIWISSSLETGGWPINFIPLLITYLHRRSKHGPAIKPPVFLAAAVISLLTCVDDYLYAYGVAKLPVSTSALIIASQLGFTALFAFLMVGQKFTSYSINAVFLLTVGAGSWRCTRPETGRPAGESKREYYTGFFLTPLAAALYGFVLPLTYKKAKQAVTCTLVLEIQLFFCLEELEIQLVMCFFATVVCAVGHSFKNRPILIISVNTY